MEHYFTNNENLKSDFRTIIYKYEDYKLEFTSDLGVFSKDKVDFGSRLLMETYFKHGRKNVNLLDVGCGYGFLGIHSHQQNTLLFHIPRNSQAYF